MRREVVAPGVPFPDAYYAHAVVAGNLVFVSGCAPTDESGGIVGRDAAEQCRQALHNLELSLDACGASFADITKVTVFLTDISDRPRIDPVRREFFGDTRPASTLVEVSALALPDMKVEIEAIAVL
jgi:2-iminobutanoate/2-iminopropanoate deaminase